MREDGERDSKRGGRDRKIVGEEGEREVVRQEEDRQNDSRG